MDINMQQTNRMELGLYCVYLVSFLPTISETQAGLINEIVGSDIGPEGYRLLIDEKIDLTDFQERLPVTFSVFVDYDLSRQKMGDDVRYTNSCVLLELYEGLGQALLQSGDVITEEAVVNNRRFLEKMNDYRNEKLGFDEPLNKKLSVIRNADSGDEDGEDVPFKFEKR